MAHIELVDQTFRDGQQSLWGMRIRTGMPERAVPLLARVILAAGGQAYGAIFFGISPVHTDQWFAARVREMVQWNCLTGLHVEDAPGTERSGRQGQGSELGARPVFRELGTSATDPRGIAPAVRRRAEIVAGA
jgi:pyruvate/oxaloacetate carboxyltransferase